MELTREMLKDPCKPHNSTGMELLNHQTSKISVISV
jgi:hypothetical protein